MMLKNLDSPIKKAVKRWPARWYSHGDVKISYPNGDVIRLTSDGLWKPSLYSNEVEDLIEDCEFMGFIK